VQKQKMKKLKQNGTL